MVELDIRLEKSSDRLGMFYFFFTVCTLGLMRIGVERYLMPPPVPTSSAASNALWFLPLPLSCTRFADLSLRSPAINLVVSNGPATQQHPPHETPSPTPERVSGQGPGEWRTFFSVAFCCGGHWLPKMYRLRHLLATFDHTVF